MTHKKWFFIAVLFLAALLALIIHSVYTVMPHNPLECADELVLVVSRTETSHKAVLQAFTRENGLWRFNFAFPVVIGENGMAWGEGLQRESSRIEDEPVKQEGDRRSPKGVFTLLSTYGTLPKSHVRIRFPYSPITDNIKSLFLAETNHVSETLRSENKSPGFGTIPAPETTVNSTCPYKYVITAGGDPGACEAGKESFILIHIWEHEESFTGGSTAMSEESILMLLAWLDAAKKPLLVQLTRKSYLRLKEEWGLPDITL